MYNYVGRPVPIRIVFYYFWTNKIKCWCVDVVRTCPGDDEISWSWLSLAKVKNWFSFLHWGNISNTQYVNTFICWDIISLIILSLTKAVSLWEPNLTSPLDGVERKESGGKERLMIPTCMVILEKSIISSLLQHAEVVPNPYHPK